MKGSLEGHNLKHLSLSHQFIDDSLKNQPEGTSCSPEQIFCWSNFEEEPLSSWEKLFSLLLELFLSFQRSHLVSDLLPSSS